MNKIYKLRVWWFYWLGYLVFSLLLIFLLYKGEVLITSPIIIILITYFLFWFAYALSHRFEIDSYTKEIREKFLGIAYRKYKIDDIKEYYIKEHDTIIMGGRGIIPSGANDTLVNLRLSSSQGEIFKEIFWNIDLKNANDLFFKAKEINSNIIQSNESFYNNFLYKPRPSKYLKITVIVLIIIFFITFFYILNNIMRPSA